MEQKKRGGKKLKRKTDITVVNDSRCSSNIGYIRTFLAKCMFCATVPRVTCSVSDLFCIQKTENCDRCVLCGVKKAPGADFAPGACPPILSKKMMTFKCVFLFQKKEPGVLFAPSSDLFLVTRGGIEPPLPP